MGLLLHVGHSMCGLLQAAWLQMRSAARSQQQDLRRAGQGLCRPTHDLQQVAATFFAGLRKLTC